MRTGTTNPRRSFRRSRIFFASSERPPYLWHCEQSAVGVPVE